MFQVQSGCDYIELSASRGPLTNTNSVPVRECYLNLSYLPFLSSLLALLVLGWTKQKLTEMDYSET